MYFYCFSRYSSSMSKSSTHLLHVNQRPWCSTLVIGFLVLLAQSVLGQNVASPASPLNNKGVPVSQMPHLSIQRVFIYTPATEWTYSHHASITHFKDLWVATWSNGHVNEDNPGQRVLYTTSRDFFHWTPPQVLAAPGMSPTGTENILTAAGFHQFGDTLVAYYGEYDVNRKHTHLWAKTSTDGHTWGPALDMHMPVNPNLGPAKIASGRLIISGNYTLPYTDDPTGLRGWKMSSFYPADSAFQLEDNPATFGTAARKLKLPALCETSFFQTDDQVLHAMFRVTGRPLTGFLYEAESDDNGEHWTRPVLTSFTNKDSKFDFGRLPDGRFFYVGNSDTARTADRNPLVISTSTNGVDFNKSYIIADKVYQMKKPGKSKGGQYGYPTTVIYRGKVYVIVSREKEAVEVIRFDISQLK